MYAYTGTLVHGCLFGSQGPDIPSSTHPTEPQGAWRPEGPQLPATPCSLLEKRSPSCITLCWTLLTYMNHPDSVNALGAVIKFSYYQNLDTNIIRDQHWGFDINFIFSPRSSRTNLNDHSNQINYDLCTTIHFRYSFPSSTYSNLVAPPWWLKDIINKSMKAITKKQTFNSIFDCAAVKRSNIIQETVAFFSF